jgi:hypothetical protein
MHPLFAHHDMRETLDVLGINPATPLDHALALASYGLLAFALFLGLRWAGQGLSRLVRSARTLPEPSSATTTRAVEG